MQQYPTVKILKNYKEFKEKVDDVKKMVEPQAEAYEDELSAVIHLYCNPASVN